MLLYNEEQQGIFLDILQTFIMFDKQETKKELELLNHLKNDVFKNSKHFPRRMEPKDLPQNIQKIDVDVYLVYLFNLLYDLANDPEFNTKAIRKEDFIKKVNNLLDSLDDTTKEKIITHNNFHKSSKNTMDSILSGSEKLLEESQKQFEKIQKTSSSIFSKFIKKGN